MKQNITNILVILCIILAGINIYLLINRDIGKDDESITADVVPKQNILTNEQRDAESPKEDLKAVDLGLSVYWANCNLGAESPEAYGNCYRWGEIEEVPFYDGEDWEAYKYCDERESCISYNFGTSISATQYDAAYVATGGTWRMPTVDEIEELFQNCNCTLGHYRSTEGIWLSSPNGNSIFLPRVIWSSTQNPNKNEEAYAFTCDESGTPKIVSPDRCRTIWIRPVKNK